MSCCRVRVHKDQDASRSLLGCLACEVCLPLEFRSLKALGLLSSPSRKSGCCFSPRGALCPCCGCSAAIWRCQRAGVCLPSRAARRARDTCGLCPVQTVRCLQVALEVLMLACDGLNARVEPDGAASARGHHAALRSLRLAPLTPWGRMAATAP